MEYKSILKHTAIILGIFYFFGILGFLFHKLFKFYSGSYGHLYYTLILAVLLIIILPIIYSYKVKKSMKEWLIIIAILFIVSYGIMFFGQQFVSYLVSSFRLKSIASFFISIVNSNPLYLFGMSICFEYNVKAIIGYPLDQLPNYFYCGRSFLAYATPIIGAYLIFLGSLFLGNLFRNKFKEKVELKVQKSPYPY